MLLGSIIAVALGALIAVGLIMDARSRRNRAHLTEPEEQLTTTAEMVKYDTAELDRVEDGAPYLAEVRSGFRRKSAN